MRVGAIRIRIQIAIGFHIWKPNCNHDVSRRTAYYVLYTCIVHVQVEKHFMEMDEDVGMHIAKNQSNKGHLRTWHHIGRIKKLT